MALIRAIRATAESLLCHFGLKKLDAIRSIGQWSLGLVTDNQDCQQEKKKETIILDGNIRSHVYINWWIFC